MIIKAYKMILDEPSRKTNIKWVDTDSEFHIRSIMSWLQDNGIKIIQHIMKENQ